MYKFIESAISKEVDEFVFNHELNSFNQSSKWAMVKNNWDSLLTCVKDDNDNIVASALILFRKAPLGYTLAYIPKGPVMDYENKELVEFTMSKLKDVVKKHKAFVLKIDPPVLSKKYKYKDRKKDNPLMNENIVNHLKSLGAKHLGYTKMISEATQPRYNAMIEIDENFKETIPHKTIRSIEKARHKGATIYTGKEELSNFAKCMHYTEDRKGIALRNEDYFKTMIDAFEDSYILEVSKLNFPKQIEYLEKTIEENKTKLATETNKKEIEALNKLIKDDEEELARDKEDYKKLNEEEILLCGLLAIYNDNLMELLYMGNNPDGMRIRSSYYIYQYAIDYCIEHGIKKCSFGGIEGTLDDGLTIFKSNWPIFIEEYIGEFNFVLNKPVNYVFEKVYAMRKG